VHRVLVGKPEGKRPLGRPRRRWEDNINTLRTGDANLRFLRFLHYNCERRMTQICFFNTRLVSKHFITQYMERFSEWSSGPDV
jgi:hypothetical protein